MIILFLPFLLVCLPIFSLLAKSYSYMQSRSTIDQKFAQHSEKTAGELNAILAMNEELNLINRACITSKTPASLAALQVRAYQLAQTQDIKLVQLRNNWQASFSNAQSAWNKPVRNHNHKCQIPGPLKWNSSFIASLTNEIAGTLIFLDETYKARWKYYNSKVGTL